MELENTTYRLAHRNDLYAIVELIADDQLGATHERLGKPLSAGYTTAFDLIDADPNQSVLVGVLAETIVACLQLSFLPGLSHQGAWRAQIEAVRVAGSYRNHGIGEAIVREAISMAS